MNHGDGEGGWKAWLPMIVCCLAMVGVFIALALGGWSLR